MIEDKDAVVIKTNVNAKRKMKDRDRKQIRHGKAKIRQEIARYVFDDQHPRSSRINCFNEISDSKKQSSVGIKEAASMKLLQTRRMPPKMRKIWRMTLASRLGRPRK
jgi:hypothetical protein